MAGTPPSSVPSSSSGTTVLFDSTLGVDTASIDTGAAGIALTANVLTILVSGYTDEAGAVVNVDVTLNNDTGANYDMTAHYASNATPGATVTLAATKWACVFHGSGGSGAYPAALQIIIPNYTNAVNGKQGNAFNSILDGTAANVWNIKYGLGYRGAAAISRFKVAGQAAAKLKAGTRVIITGS